MYEYKAKVKRVIDGDSVIFTVDLGFHTLVEINGRLAEVDTPERGQADFHRATNLFIELLHKNTDKEGWNTIRTEKTGKYGRWIVYIAGVNDTMKELWPYV